MLENNLERAGTLPPVPDFAIGNPEKMRYNEKYVLSFFILKEFMSMNKSIYDTPSYIRSRRAYRAQCMFEYFTTLLVSDAYLAKLLDDIGMSDSLIGILSSLIAAAFLFQLPVIFFVQKLRRVKRIAVISHSISLLLFASLFLIPMLPFSREVKTAMVVAGLLSAYFCRYVVLNIIFRWANSFVDPAKRGEYSAGKEMISLFGGMLFTLIVSHVMDSFEAAGNLHGGFLFAAIVGILIAGLDFMMLLLIEDRPESIQIQRTPVHTVLWNLIQNGKFRSVVVLNIMWQSACYLTIGFLGIYKIKELMLTVGAVQIINILGNICRFAVSRAFGRYADKKSYAHCFELAMTVAAVGFFLNLFTTPQTWFLIALYTLLYSASLAGIEQNFYNIIYNCVPEEEFVQALALKNSMGGVFGFLASLTGSRILSYVQSNGSFLGLHIYGQQALSFLSLLLIIAAIVYNRLVVIRKTVRGKK